MAAQQGHVETLGSLRLLAEYVRKGGRVEDVKDFLEALGVKQALESIGVGPVGVERFWEALSPEKLAQQDKPADTTDNT